MAQEANGLPYYSGNKTGTGAVYLSDTVDTLGLGERNLDRINIAIQNKGKANEAKKKAALEMIGDMDVNTDGIMDTDAPYFKQRLADLGAAYSKALQTGLDPSNPAFIQASAALQTERNQILNDIAQSKAERGIYTGSATKYDPKKHSDESLRNQALFRSTPFAERTKYDPSKLLIGKKDSLNDLIAKFTKPYEEHMSETTKVLPPNKQGQIIEQTTKFSLSPNATAADFGKYADAFYDNDTLGKEAVDYTWDAMDDVAKEPYTRMYIAQGDPPSVAEYKAKKDLLANRFMQANKLVQSENYAGEGSGYKAAVNYGYGQKEEANKGRVLPEIVAQIKLGDDAVMQKTVYVAPDGKQNEVYGTRVLNNYDLGKRRLPALGLKNDTTGMYSVKLQEAAGTTGTVNTPVYEDVEVRPTMQIITDDGTIQIATTESERMYALGMSKTPFIPFQTEGALLSYLNSAGNSSTNNHTFGTADQQKAYINSRGAGGTGSDYNAEKLLGWNEKKKKSAEAAKRGVVVFTELEKHGGSGSETQEKIEW